MPIQEPVLGPISGNKGKKKATGKNAKGRKRARSAEEDRYNATLELAIEEEKENAAHVHSSEREDEDHYDLAMEEPPTEEPDGTIEENPPPHSTYVPETPSNTTLPPLDPCTPTKSRSISTFEPAVNIDSSKNRGSLKRPAADSPSSFGALFLSRKSAKVNSLDNDLLMQMMEKIESLTKFSKEQSELIKCLQGKIDNLIRTDENAERSLAPPSQPTMASQVVAFANSNCASDVPALPSPLRLTLAKPAGDSHLSIDFRPCSVGGIVPPALAAILHQPKLLKLLSWSDFSVRLTTETGGQMIYNFENLTTVKMFTR